MERILAIIPCHNEQETISQTIANIKVEIPEAHIVVVDNASTDLTEQVVKNIPGIYLLHEPSKGKGFALRKAFSVLDILKYDAILMTDGDDTYAMDSFWEAFNLVTKFGVDMVVGNRVPYEAEFEAETRHFPFRKFHALGNTLISKFSELLFGYYIKDALSGWRVMSSGFIVSFYGGASGFEIESELNAHCFILKSTPASVDVTYRGRILESNSKLKTWSDGLRIIRRQMALFRSERPLLSYTFLSLPWLLLSITLIRNVISTFIKTHLVPNFPSLIAGVGGFIVATLLFITGLLLENVRLTRVQAARYKYSESKL